MARESERGVSAIPPETEAFSVPFSDPQQPSVQASMREDRAGTRERSAAPRYHAPANSALPDSSDDDNHGVVEDLPVRPPPKAGPQPDIIEEGATLSIAGAALFLDRDTSKNKKKMQNNTQQKKKEARKLKPHGPPPESFPLVGHEYHDPSDEDNVEAGIDSDSNHSSHSEIDDAAANDFVANCECDGGSSDVPDEFSGTAAWLRRSAARTQPDSELTDLTASNEDDEANEGFVERTDLSNDLLSRFNAMPGKRSMKKGKGKAHEAPPGEKKKARKAKIEAKRLDRAEQKIDGMDFSLVLERLQMFVDRGMDMDALPPCHGQARDVVERICAEFGVKTSSTAASSGKVKTLIIKASNKMGQPTREGLERISQLVDPQALLAAQKKRTKASSRSKSDNVGKNANQQSQRGKKSSVSKDSAQRGKAKGKRVPDPPGPSFERSGEVLQADDEEMEQDNPVTSDHGSLAIVDAKPTLGATAGASLAVSGEQAETYRAFEKYTTGFGSKILQKFGYVEGYGLGKRGEGIVEPVAAYQRPKRAGLGADG